MKNNTTIECIDVGNNKYITVGKKYSVRGNAQGYYHITNDKGDREWYNKNLFVIVNNTLISSYEIF